MSIKDIKKRIKEYFLFSPTKRLRVRQIERKVAVPLPSAIRYTKELVKERIFKSTIIAGVRLFSADRTSKEFLLEKKLFNLRQLHESGLIEHVKHKLGNPVIVVFGSYSRGEDIETSDIDLYIESSQRISLKQFESRLKRNIQIFAHKGIKTIKNKELANNIINGFVVNGYMEVFK